MRMLLTLTVVVAAFSSAALAQEASQDPGQTKPAKTTVEPTTEVKLTEIRFCPMMGHNVQGNGAGQRVYNNYKLYFC